MNSRCNTMHQHLTLIHLSRNRMGETRSFHSGCHAQTALRAAAINQVLEMVTSSYPTRCHRIGLFLLLREATPEIWVRKLNWIAKHGGMVLLDVHPDYMSFDTSRQTSTQYPVTLYREFLNYVKTRYAGEYWHVLPSKWQVTSEWHSNRIIRWTA